MHSQKPSPRQPAALPDGTVGEQYAFIKVDMTYDSKYEEGLNNEQSNLEELLDEFVLTYKPRSYRIINAQVVYLGEGTSKYNTMPSGIQHVIHIGYHI